MKILSVNSQKFLVCFGVFFDYQVPSTISSLWGSSDEYYVKEEFIILKKHFYFQKIFYFKKKHETIFFTLWSLGGAPAPHGGASHPPASPLFAFCGPKNAQKSSKVGQIWTKKVVKWEVIKNFLSLPTLLLFWSKFVPLYYFFGHFSAHKMQKVGSQAGAKHRRVARERHLETTL